MMRDMVEIAKDIRQALKREFPGMTWSVTSKGYPREIAVRLMKAPVSPFSGPDIGSQHAKLNHYHIKQDDSGVWKSGGYQLTPAAAKMFLRVIELANAENWDKSDIQSDYFNVNYYFDLSIGRWDKPFQVG